MPASVIGNSTAADAERSFYPEGCEWTSPYDFECHIAADQVVLDSESLEMTSNDIRPPRSLTKGEAFILQQIQDLYGHQNAETEVFFTDLDEAAIWVKDKDGVRNFLAVLTNLAAECEDGTIASLEELRKVLLPPEMVPPKI